MRYIRTVIITVGTSQISKEIKHFIRKTVRELLSFKFIPQGYLKKKWNKSLPLSPRLSEVCWGPHAREVLPLGTPLLQHLPKPATWDSQVHLKFFPWPRESFWKTIFWQTGLGEGFGMFQVQFIYCALYFYFCSLMAPLVKSLPAVQETGVQSLGREDLLEKETTAHSSILAWRIQWTEEPCGLQRFGHGWVTKHLFLVWFHQLHLRSAGIRS